MGHLTSMTNKIALKFSFEKGHTDMSNAQEASQCCSVHTTVWLIKKIFNFVYHHPAHRTRISSANLHHGF
jgi:hypothetical protein